MWGLPASPCSSRSRTGRAACARRCGSSTTPSAEGRPRGSLVRFQRSRDLAGLATARPLCPHSGLLERAVHLAQCGWAIAHDEFGLEPGKNLALSAADAILCFTAGSYAALDDQSPPPPASLRFRLSPGDALALSVNLKTAGVAMVGEGAELALARPAAGRLKAYERLLGDALYGDASQYAKREPSNSRGACSMRRSRPSRRCTRTTRIVWGARGSGPHCARSRLGHPKA